jgi:hypothetical protein
METNKNKDLLKVKSIINSVNNSGQLEVAIKVVDSFRIKHGLKYDSPDIKLLNKLIDVKRTESRINRGTGDNIGKGFDIKQSIRKYLKNDLDTIEEDSYWDKDKYWNADKMTSRWDNDPYWGSPGSSSSETE